MKTEIGPYTTAPGVRRRVFKNWTMWAEDGLVFLEDQADGEIKMMPCGPALEKLRAFAEEADAWDKRKQDADPRRRAYAIDYHATIKGLVESLRDTIADAKVQGDPTDEQVRRHKLRLFLRSKREGHGGASLASILAAAFGTAPPDPIVFQADAKWLARGPKGVDQRY